MSPPSSSFPSTDPDVDGGLYSLDSRTHVHGPTTPLLPDRSIPGPFGPMTITREQYYQSVANRDEEDIAA